MCYNFEMNPNESVFNYFPSERYLQAINLASRLHRDQKRHDHEHTPYISHLYAVSYILSKYTRDEDIVIAGLMHDSLEDVPDYTYDKLVLDCGARVADLVLGVTEDMSLQYIERKRKYLDKINAGSIECVLISLADKTHNLMSVREIRPEHNHNGHNMIYCEVYAIASTRLANHLEYMPLVKILKKELEGVV